MGAAAPGPAAAAAPLASALAGPAAFVSADVALDSAEPVVGSFTADGMTYALDDGLTLVAVDASVVVDGAIAVPSPVSYDGTAYDVTAIGPYAFYLSGATSVALPATISLVDGRALRSSDVERIEVDAGNPDLASFDGCLYDSQLNRLLLIPGGRQGAVRIAPSAEEVDASAFSHCAGVDAISVDAGSAAYASWDGLLYDASGTTLLRVPAGAPEITIRDGCTTIAAGALEGCAKLERINAPASVTSISPDAFTSVPTVLLPAQSAMQDEASSSVASSLLDQANASTNFAPQLAAMVALSTVDGSVLKVDPSLIEIAISEESNADVWKNAGFSRLVAQSNLTEKHDSASASLVLQSGAIAFDNTGTRIYMNGGTCTRRQYGGKDTWPITYGDSGVDVYTDWYNWNCSTSQIQWRSPAGTKGGGDEWIRDFNRSGYHMRGWSTNASTVPWGSGIVSSFSFNQAKSSNWYAIWCPNSRNLTLDGQGAISGNQGSVSAVCGSRLPNVSIPNRPGYVFGGYWSDKNGQGAQYYDSFGRSTITWSHQSALTLYAKWEAVNYDLGFDVDSEPDDTDYSGDKKDDQTINVEAGEVAIEDPKRPGYVFEGWVLPNAGGTEAVDQELVYQNEADGKWYVDASKLPDYAGDDGRVELTARWTSVISVDVPSSVTFYADLVTQGQQSREGAASGGGANGAFGQNQVSNQSQVDLRVVGLESSAVKTEGSTLGADSILKKADAATPSSSTQKLLSLYPSTKAWTAEELQDPDAVGGTKAATAVDFDLDDILLEKSFSADDFTIAAGGTLNMGYRLNLSETGQQLDYDKLSTLSEGQSASIASVSYCFSAEMTPESWGEPLWFKNDDPSLGRVGYHLLEDIKEAADDLSAHASDPSQSSYYLLYSSLVGTGAFRLRVDSAYLDADLIGICQDAKTAGGKAGLTFQTRDLYAYATNGASGSFDCRMNTSNANSGGWGGIHYARAAAHCVYGQS